MLKPREAHIKDIVRDLSNKIYGLTVQSFEVPSRLNANKNSVHHYMHEMNRSVNLQILDCHILVAENCS